MLYFVEIEYCPSGRKETKVISASSPDGVLDKLQPKLEEKYGPDGFYIRKILPDDPNQVEYVV